MGQTTNILYLSVMLFVWIGVAEIGAQDTNLVAGSAAQPRIVCLEPNFDFGRAIGTNDVSHAFKIVNEGDAPLKITRIHVGCGCTEAKVGADTIAPHSFTDLTVQFKTAGRVGPQRKSIYVHSNDPQSPILRLEMGGDIVAPKSLGGMCGGIAVVGTPANVKPKGDFYAVPEELVLIASPGQTNTVTRFIAVRSMTGGAFKVIDVVLPFPGQTEITESTGASGFLVRLSGLLPSFDQDGKIVTIRIKDGPFLSIPVIIKNRNGGNY